MDLATATTLIATATSAVALFDAFADQVVRFIRRDPDNAEIPNDVPPKHRSVITKGDGAIQVTRNGKKFQVIKGEQLKDLPEEYYDHIRTIEASLKRDYELWKLVYPNRASSADPIVNAKVESQLRDLALRMKDDLTGIVDFLARIGVELDDHYYIYRDTIARYEGE